MVAKFPLVGVVTVTSIAAAMIVPPAHAVEQDSSSQSIDGQSCPAVHTIAVQSKKDSHGGGESDSGLLGGVINPVASAAGGSGDATGGFSVTTSQSDHSTSQGSGSRDGVTEFAPLGSRNRADSGSRGAQMSRNGVTEFAPLGGGRENTTDSSPAVSAESVAPSSAAPSAVQSDRKLTRTYVTVAGGSDQAYVPWVDEKLPDTYDEQVQQAVGEVESVLHDVHTKCPQTKVVLAGSVQGAQVAGIVARKIGHNESEFPASQLAGVALFSDPLRSAGQPAAGAATGIESGSSPAGQGVATLDGASTGDFGSVQDRTVSWCAEGDARCSTDTRAPLTKLAAQAQEKAHGDPVEGLHWVANVLAPAVTLGTAETLAEDVEFDRSGFSLKKASSRDETLIGRISNSALDPANPSDYERRLIAAGQRLGGIGLAAGITVAAKTLTPATIAQVAAAGAISPMAGAAVAGAKLAEASLDLIAPRTASTAVSRLFDEADAAGLETDEVARAAVESAVTDAVGELGYSSRPVNSRGETAAGATSGWLARIVAGELGDAAPSDLVALGAGTATAAFNAAATTGALDALAG